jgi:hypothetical protein
MLWIGVAAAGLLAAAAQAQAPVPSVVVGGRYHAASTVLPDLPYDDGDLSLLVAYQLEEAASVLQFALDYAWDAGARSNAVDYVLTPQINVLFRRNWLAFGTGALMSRIEGEGEGTGWTGLYYQFLAGTELDLGSRASLTALAAYPFDDFGELGEFDTGDLEYTVYLKFRFGGYLSDREKRRQYERLNRR